MQRDEGGFDYSVVTKPAARELRETAEQVRKIARISVLEVGKNLNRVKRLLPHGDFLQWAQEECGLEPRIAQKMMKVAQVIKCENYSLLEIGQSALYAITEGTCPKEARAEALELAANGSFVSYGLAKAIIERHKPKKDPKPPPRS